MQTGSTQDLNNLAGVDRLVRIFLDLIAYDTRADHEARGVPSSIGQLRLGAFLLAQLNKISIPCRQTPEGVIICRIPASPGLEHARRLCLLAHLDTSPDFSGANVAAQLVRSYRGQAVTLRSGLVLSPELCPALAAHAGDDLIVTDGTTLLGADDKAGVAILVLLMQSIVHEGLEHGPLTVVFSVDEELGRSCDYINVEELECDFAVTIDGMQLGQLDVANFNAMRCQVQVTGRSLHTAEAYKQLRNAAAIAADFVRALPPGELPETTCGREGFYHLQQLHGTVAAAEAELLLRDFEEQGLQRRVRHLQDMADFFNRRHGPGTVTLSFEEQYRNMHKVLRRHPQIVRLCRRAYARAGVEVAEHFVRGGTDGAQLSHRGLPCPNIFTGVLNPHGPYECLPVKAFNLAYRVTENLVREVAATRSR